MVVKKIEDDFSFAVLWHLTRHCSQLNPDSRPTASEVFFSFFLIFPSCFNFSLPFQVCWFIRRMRGIQRQKIGPHFVGEASRSRAIAIMHEVSFSLSFFLLAGPLDTSPKKLEKT